MAVTGRPKSQNPKRHIVSVRMTDSEKEALEWAYGSATRGLRHLVGKATEDAVSVRTEPADAGTGTRGVTVNLGDGTQDVALTITGQGGGGGTRHIHKPANLIRDFADKGTAMQEWACSCGHLMTRRAA